MGESRHLLRHSNASGAIRNRGVIALAFALSLFAAVLAPAGGAPRAEAATGTATIGGSIWDGGNPTVPLTHAMGAKVMVQNQHSGGAWVAYGTINGNKWTATVPAPGDYVVMFSAHGYDATSREYIVDDGDTMNKDAYLPPLPLPDANLLVYAFYDNYVNGEPDDFPEDIPLNGVEFTVRDEEGNILATGLTGSQATITQSNGTLLTSTDGLYYFTGLPPGEVIVTSDPSAAYAHTQPVDPQTGLPFGSGWTASTEFYLMTSEEGGPAWDPKLYPGDPGTEDGGFLIWHGYTEKLGQVGDPTNPTPFNPALVGTISGTLIDADAANLDPDEPFPVPGEDHPGVSLNTVVPDGFVVLYSSAETVPVHPVATTEAHPVTGEYSFVNVPPGSYKMFLSDVPIDYVWNQAQVRVAPGQDITLSPLVPRFFARAQGCVYDDSTGHPMTGLDVNIRFKSGSVKKTETTA
ncbi:MAG: hypothetical protein ACE5E8_03605, partial [Acidimicrobiia bacterium]